MVKKKKIKELSLIQMTRREAVVEISLNRPDCLNAFNVNLATQLGQALQQVAKDRSVRAVIIRGEGKAFSAGGDLKMFYENKKNASPLFKKISSLLNQAVKIVRTMPKPVIVGIHGPAYAAGFGFALSADLILVSESAKLSASFINIALAPNGSSSLFLPRLVGWRRASECFFTAKVLSAQEAYDWGIVNRVVSDDQFDQALWDFASDLAKRPTRTIARTKLLLNQSIGFDFTKQLTKEMNTIAWSSTTPDFIEGVTAFVEKRKPDFHG